MAPPVSSSISASPSTTDVPAAPMLSLAGLFARAWARQPEARSADLRRQSLALAREGSRSWLAGAPSLLLQAQTDRPGTGQGERELEVGLALPLWRPGQSAQTQATHEAEATAHEHQLNLQRWRLAGVVREAWWHAQRTHTDLLQAQARIQNARALAHDVARRVQAGDLARADQHQAESAVAQALWTLAQAQGAQESALEQLRQLSGDWSLSSPPLDRTDMPDLPELPDSVPPTHPWLIAAQARETLARAQARQAEVSRTSPPELTLLSTRATGPAGEPARRSVTVGIQWPFTMGGPAAQAEAQVLAAWSAAHEAESERVLVHEQLRAHIAQARARLRSAQAQWAAAQDHQRLASETRTFFERSFQMGQTDLPTRLRIDHEAAQAQHALHRARIDLRAAWSDWQHALGQLPTE
ncbi:TolC family protein [Aquabacterium sp. A3]|uniref:TolC family protein n=1 Tax=Aquabacterium sp. A3 TaxID=3132829 RepID=UPI003119A7FB